MIFWTIIWLSWWITRLGLWDSVSVDSCVVVWLVRLLTSQKSSFKLTIPGRIFIKSKPGYVITLLKSTPQCLGNVSMYYQILFFAFPWSTFLAMIHIQDPPWGSAWSFPSMPFIWFSLTAQTPFLYLSGLLFGSFKVELHYFSEAFLFPHTLAEFVVPSFDFLLLCHHCSGS